MTAWRVIITDSEGLSGVAPVCPSQNDYTRHSAGFGVYDCCPGPHIECYRESAAQAVARALTAADAEVCP